MINTDCLKLLKHQFQIPYTKGRASNLRYIFLYKESDTTMFTSIVCIYNVECRWITVSPNQPIGCSKFPFDYRFDRTLSRDISRYCSSCGEPREIERSHITRPLTRSCWYEPGLMYDLCLYKARKPQIVDTKAGAIVAYVLYINDNNVCYLTCS